MRQSGQGPEIPPPLELECLRALWRLGDGTVKDVRGIMTERRNLAYTTVMTVLDRLVKRGAAARQKHGRSFVYKPAVGRDVLRRLAVQDLVDSFFDGSADSLRAYLEGRLEEPPLPAAEAPEAAAKPDDDDRLETELL